MPTTSEDSIQEAVFALIAADMSLEETRAAFWALIPKEFHVTHFDR